MSTQSIRAKARSIANFSLLQIVVAVGLVAAGFVHVAHGLRSDAIGVPVGIAAGLALYLALAAGDTTTPVAAKANAIRNLALLLAGVSIAEEIIWRGFALQALQATSGTALAFVATTIGFAAAHADTQGWSGVRYHLISGLVFGLVCLATGSLLSAIAAHLSYNMMFVRRIALQGSIVR